MAKTIYQRIALQGGDAIKKELNRIGKDGEAALLNMSKAASQLGKNLASVGTSFKNFGSSLATVGTRLGIVAGAATGAAAGVVALAKSGTEMADAATKQAQAIGLAVEEYGRLSWAASQSGVDQAGFATAMTRLNQELGKVADGSKSSTEKFKALGVAVYDARGNIRSTEAIMADLADAFAKMPNGASKSAAAIEIFGRSGAQMIPFLNAGSKGLRDLGAEAERLGIVFTAEQATIAEGMNDALAALGKAVSGTKAQIGLLFAPSITEAARAMQGAIEDNRAAIQRMAETGLRKAIPLARDLVNAMLGNDAEVQNSWIIEARNAVISFADTVQSAIMGIIVPAYEMIVSAANSVADAVNGMFGTEFTGQQVLVAAAVAKLLGIFGLLTSGIALVAKSGLLLVSAFKLGAASAPVLGAALSSLVTLGKGLLLALAPLLGWPALLIAAVAGLGVALYVYWDEIVAGAAWMWDALKEGFGALWDIVRLATLNALIWIADQFIALPEKFRAWGAAAGEFFADGLRKIADLGRGVWDAVISGADAAWDYLSGGFDSVLDGIGDMFDGLVRRATSAWNKIKSLASSARSALSSAFSSGSSAATPGYAGGGYISGPGTGTSDSILARLSNGEFVVKAAAVRHYGTDLLRALNAMRLPKLPGFSIGGLVDGITRGVSISGALPRFADGGLVAAPAASGRPVTVNINGESYQMMADDDTAERLARHATGRKLRSAGRKPGWVA